MQSLAYICMSAKTDIVQRTPHVRSDIHTHGCMSYTVKWCVSLQPPVKHYRGSDGPDPTPTKVQIQATEKRQCHGEMEKKNCGNLS